MSKRVYKDPMAPKDAFKIILDGAGNHFDPNIVEAISGLEKEFAEIALDEIPSDDAEKTDSAA